MTKPITTRAFGKIIISGEHAVVYGQPALAMSVDCHMQTTIALLPNANKYTFVLENFGMAESFTRQQLQTIGKISVLQQPSQLLPYALAKLIKNFDIKTDNGLEIRTISTIPINYGLGSSAALIISLLHAVNHFFALNINPENYLSIGMDIEHIQHGKSSGLDIYLATNGGILRFEQGKIVSRQCFDSSLECINSGRSQSSTAECVSAVAQYFSHSKLASDFGAITNKLDEAWETQDLMVLKESIRANHQLLSYIGVVPEKVQRFVKEVEAKNGAAKICGAGAIRGENVGVIMVMTDEDISDLLIKYGYESLKLKSNERGVQIV
jgi:mevalonate kinase